MLAPDIVLAVNWVDLRHIAPSENFRLLVECVSSPLAAYFGSCPTITRVIRVCHREVRDDGGYTGERDCRQCQFQHGRYLKHIISRIHVGETADYRKPNSGTEESDHLV